MEVILLESLNKLGRAGDIVSVKDGFARNFLIPQKKAIIANKKNKSDLETRMSEISKNNEIKIKEANDLKNSVDGKTIKIEMESNEDGNLYGAVTQRLIVETIFNSMSLKLSADCIILTPIKTLGLHEVKLRLYDNVHATINLELINKS